MSECSLRRALFLRVSQRFRAVGLARVRGGVDAAVIASVLCGVVDRLHVSLSDASASSLGVSGWGCCPGLLVIVLTPGWAAASWSAWSVVCLPVSAGLARSGVFSICSPALSVMGRPGAGVVLSGARLGWSRPCGGCALAVVLSLGDVRAAGVAVWFMGLLVVAPRARSAFGTLFVVVGRSAVFGSFCLVMLRCLPEATPGRSSSAAIVPVALPAVAMRR